MASEPDALGAKSIIKASVTLALEAAAFLAARRKPVYGRPSKFKVERRVLPPRPVSELPIRSAQPSAPAAASRHPIADDLARILAGPRAFPRALM